MRLVVEILKNPLALVFLFLFISLIFRFLHRKKTANLLFIGSLAYLWITSVPIFSRPAVYWLEKQNTPLVVPPDSLKIQPVNILVLGGGHSNNEILPHSAQLNSLSLGRLVEGIRLHQQLPESKMIFSGYNGRELTSHAKKLFSAAHELGCDTSTIDTLPQPNNTHAEAFFYSCRYPTDIPLILVTDAIHMPRALRYFQQYGINPIPAPTNFILKSDKTDWRIFCIPSGTTIFNTERTLHEYIGLLWQAIGGR